jgi:aromatic ring hydroxylase
MLMTGSEYLESIRDGRRVYIGSERVDDVTTHPAFRNAAQTLATIYHRITQEKGGCLPQDLNERGFTPEEVAKHWHMAKSLADVELKLIAEKPAKPKFILRDK